MPHGDRYLETSINPTNKYWIGKVIERFGKKFEITRIEERKDGQGYDIYAKQVYNK